ncbi:MAG: MFS transporter [Gammaproteobacteria bacterium]|nr:MFS transporter [Gammaproteobacteria bacterium]
MSATSADREAGANRRWFVVAAAAVGLGCGLASLVAATFGVFIGPIRGEFGWAASDTFSALLVVTFTAALLSPVVGGFVDRYGARRVVLLGFVAEVLIFASFYWQGPALWSFYLRYFLLAVLTLGTTHVAFARVITLWFEERRGLALGLALSGVGLGGFVWPIFSQFMIGLVGWRAAYLALALTIGLVAIPVIYLLLLDKPPASAAAGATPSSSVTSAELPGMSFAETARTGRYWLLLGTFFLIGLVVQSVSFHLVPLLTERGFPPMVAAATQSALFFAVTSGRLLTGWLMDRFFAPRVALAFLCGPIVGILLLAVGGDARLAVFAAVLVGLAIGAEVDVLAYLTGRYFGQRHFSRIYGSCYGIYSLSGGIGPVLTSLVVENGGGYGTALGLLAAILVLCCLLLARFPPFPGHVDRTSSKAAAD